MSRLSDIERISSRHFRKKSGICLAEGLRCCREALQRAPERVVALYCTHAFRESPDFAPFANLKDITLLDDKTFSQLAETESPQGIMLLLKIPENLPPTTAGKPFTLILDRVADPGNLGTILRTALAVGLDSCWLVKGSADPFSPKAIRAAMGAQFTLRIHTLDTLESAADTAHSLGVNTIWCTLPASGISLFDPAFSLNHSALVIGNEANGISNPAIGKAVTIPMPGGAESLNAAQAATVFLVQSLKALTDAAGNQ